MKLSKLEAAQRQLDVAAKLFVAKEDELALHTLSAAAEEILGKLVERSGQESMFQRMKGPAEQKLGKSLTLGELSGYVNKSRNALKHANDPSEDSFEYDPDHAVGMFFRALVNYQLVTGALTDTMEKALAALSKEHPHLVEVKA